MTRPISEAAESTVTLAELVHRARVAAEPVEATWAMAEQLSTVAAHPQRVSEPCRRAARMLQSAVAATASDGAAPSLRHSLDIFFAASSLNASLDAVESVVAAVNQREKRTIQLRELPEHRAQAQEAGRVAEQALRAAVPRVVRRVRRPHRGAAVARWPRGRRAFPAQRSRTVLCLLAELGAALAPSRLGGGGPQCSSTAGLRGTATP